MTSQESTTVYIGNLKNSTRIGDLKISLYKLLKSVLKLQISQKDINIINGSKRYALIDVHHQQNVDFLLHKLKDFDSRLQLNFNFLSIVDKGTSLHIDTVKSQDEKQARDDFENAKNMRPFQKPHRYFKRHRPDFGRAISVKTSKSFTSKSSSRSGASAEDNTRVPSVSYTSSDLDVTLEEDEEDEEEDEIHSANVTPTNTIPENNAEVMHKKVKMIPVGDSTLVEEDNETDLAETIRSSLSTPIMPERSESQNSHYEDPPGSVIDLRHVSRASFNSKVTPRIHRRKSSKDYASSRAETRQDFFQFLDRQIGMNLKNPEAEEVGPAMSGEERLAEELRTPYYKEGEVVLNLDLTKEFRAFTKGDYTIRQVRDYMVKCVCGFLNSARKGMMLIGVGKDGTVLGIECDRQQEERFRQQFREGIKEIYPPVFTEDYDINYAPIIQDNGRQHSDRKVIEVRVRPPQNPDVLYECKDGVFVRRKGVLTGPIRPSHIQEWIRQRHFAEISELRETETFLKDELDKKDMMLRRQADTIVSQKSQLERQQQLMAGSKACTIL